MLILSIGYRYADVGVKILGDVAFPWMFGFPELVSLNDVTIVVFCGVFVVFIIIHVLTCNVAIVASALLKSPTIAQFMPFQRNIFYLLYLIH